MKTADQHSKSFGARNRVVVAALLIISACSLIAWLARNTSTTRTLDDDRAAVLFEQSNWANANSSLSSSAVLSRNEAERQLVAMGARAVPYLVSVLNERQMPARNLYGELWSKIPAILQRALPTPAPPRTDAFHAFHLLQRLGRDASAAAPDLLRLINNPWLRDGHVMMSAPTSVVTLDRSGVRTTNVVNRLQTTSSAEQLRNMALEILRNIHSDDPKVLVTLLDAIEHRDTYIAVRLRMNMLSYGVAASKIIPDLVRGLQSTNAQLRIASTEALMGSVKYEPQALKHLPAGLNVDSEETRWAVVCTLEKAANEAKFSWPALALRLATDPSNRVRGRIAIALGKLNANSPEVSAALTNALQDPEPNVREAAAEALRKIGSPADPSSSSTR